MGIPTGSTAINPATCISFNCAFCNAISPEAKHELARIARVKVFRAGETVLAEAEKIDFIGSVITGVLRVQKTLHDGRTQIVSLLLPSDMFGRVFANTLHVAIEAATDATVCTYDRGKFEALFERFPEIEHRVLTCVSDELDAAQEWMTLLALQSVTERMASFLVILRNRAVSQSNSALTIQIPISRKDMAAYLGTTVESVSRSLHELANRGVIRIVDAQNFEIRDCRRLAEIAGYTPDGEDEGARKYRLNC